MYQRFFDFGLFFILLALIYAGLKLTPEFDSNLLSGAIDLAAVLSPMKHRHFQ